VTRVLLAGESWQTTAVHTKGFDSFTTNSYEEGAGEFIAALTAAGHEVTYLPNHVAAQQFPRSVEELSAYDAVVLSDIGSNTLLLHPHTFLRGESRPNALDALAAWVEGGGALLMVGGYLSFQGIEAKANYRNTRLAEVLPVLMEIGDDREETPQGIRPTMVDPDHPVVAGLDSTWPALLGYQRLEATAGSHVLVTVDDRPLLVVGTVGLGRTMAFASDMGPHWIPAEFLQWPGYAQLWQQAVAWLAGGLVAAEGLQTPSYEEEVSAL
jgi:uncharacterized membrane protein